MTMRAAYFNHRNPLAVEGVATFEDGAELPEGFVALTAWDGFPPHPGFDGAELRCSEGVLHWHDPRPLAELRAAKWAEIKAARDAHEFGLLTWDGSTFDADERAQSRIQGAVQLATLAMAAGTELAIGWTLADNTVRTLDAADVLALGQALAGQISTAHEIARQLRPVIDASGEDDLAAITWPTASP